MKHTLIARAFGAAIIVAGASACSEHLYDLGAGALAPNEPSPSAIVIGVAPAEPSGIPDSAGTPVDAANVSAKTDLAPAVESQAMPLPGQANDHSNLAVKPSQKSGNADALKSVEQAKSANNGEGTR
jgi:hypothetical protein